VIVVFFYSLLGAGRIVDDKGNSGCLCGLRLGLQRQASTGMYVGENSSFQRRSLQAGPTIGGQNEQSALVGFLEG
jgi:hypothetical protein